MNSQLDEVKKEIAAIQHEIKAAKQKVEKAEERLEKAVGEIEIQRAKGLLESATAELTRLGKEKDRLMEKEIQLTRPVTNNDGINHQEFNSRVHSDLTDTFENMGRIEIQRHLHRLFRVGYRDDLGYITSGTELTDSAALGLLKQLYPKFKRKRSGQADAILYIENPTNSWEIDGNENDSFVSIGKDDDFAEAIASLNQTSPLGQITPPPSQEDLDKDSALAYKSNATYYAVFEITSKKKFYLDKREQLELQLAYLGLKYLIGQDRSFLSMNVEEKKKNLIEIVPRLVAFAGFCSIDRYEDIKANLIEALDKDQYPLTWLFFQSGRLIYVCCKSPGAELIQTKMDIAEIRETMGNMAIVQNNIAFKIDSLANLLLGSNKP